MKRELKRVGHPTPHRARGGMVALTKGVTGAGRGMAMEVGQVMRSRIRPLTLGDPLRRTARLVSTVVVLSVEFFCWC